jgi:hypothetical protein
MGTLGSFIWGKWLEDEADPSPPSSTENKNGRAISPLPIRHHCVLLNSLSTETNVSLTYAQMTADAHVGLQVKASCLNGNSIYRQLLVKRPNIYIILDICSAVLELSQARRRTERRDEANMRNFCKFSLLMPQNLFTLIISC